MEVNSLIPEVTGRREVGNNRLQLLTVCLGGMVSSMRVPRIHMALGVIGGLLVISVGDLGVCTV